MLPSRYVPTDWADKTELSLEEVSELNQLNIELSSTLAEKNPSFSSFQHGNFSCIMIKEVRERPGQWIIRARGNCLKS